MVYLMQVLKSARNLSTVKTATIQWESRRLRQHGIYLATCDVI